MDLDGFRTAMATAGWVKIESGVPRELLVGLRADLGHAHRTCREIQVRNRLGEVTDGAVHHIVGLGDHFLFALEELPIWTYVDDYFGGRPILNSFGGVVHVSGTRTYLGRVHRDIRTFSGSLPLMMNVLVMLDVFTAENGATYLLEGSHLRPDRPTDEAFFRDAVRAIGPAGTLVLFNSNLWHAAGENRTGRPRRALTLTLTPPYIKQQCDYPRMLGYDRAERFSSRLRQLLGYNARIPTGLEEWYQPPEKRLYQWDQG
jgi:Phytanoyl-CoA dioxygenase (PhyH)